MNKRPLLFAAAAIFVAACATVQTVDPAIQALDAALQSVQSETDASVRERKAAQLPRLMQEIAHRNLRNAVSEPMIDTMIGLLDDSGANFSACAALAELGPRSRRAIPAGQAAIARLKAEEASAQARQRASEGYVGGGPPSASLIMENCVARLGAEE